jgi:hypothetical protein
MAAFDLSYGLWVVRRGLDPLRSVSLCEINNRLLEVRSTIYYDSAGYVLSIDDVLIDELGNCRGLIVR